MSAASEAPRPGDVALAAGRRRLHYSARMRATLLLVIAGVVVVLDQASKILARSTIESGDYIGLVPGFGLTRVRNEGIAFGLFPGRPELVAALTVVALIAIGIAVARTARRSLAVAIGGGMLIGGSLGNLIDRVARGGVTDFLDPVAWPAFNAADVGIVCGVALIVLGLTFFDGEG
ncbi:MAG: signal peptidase II [Thermoleophilia bacterium]|nr:signal peptidase II [Thermoleophilia bacterium]